MTTPEGWLISRGLKFWVHPQHGYEVLIQQFRLSIHSPALEVLLSHNNTRGIALPTYRICLSRRIKTGLFLIRLSPG
jgi:hypothetical protein